MQIKMIKGGHLTAADKRDIATIIARGWLYGETRLKRYTLAALGDNCYSLKLAKNERDDWGRPITRKSQFTIEAVQS